MINRSYLSSVLKASLLLEPIVGAFSQDYRFYGEVEEALSSRNAPQSKSLLATLRKWRSEADYDLTKSINVRKARLAIHTARETLSLFEQEIV